MGFSRLNLLNQLANDIADVSRVSTWQRRATYWVKRQQDVMGAGRFEYHVFAASYYSLHRLVLLQRLTDEQRALGTWDWIRIGSYSCSV